MLLVSNVFSDSTTSESLPSKEIRIENPSDYFLFS